MRFFAVVCCLLVLPTVAFACGEWKLLDAKGKQVATFYLRTTKTQKPRRTFYIDRKGNDYAAKLRGKIIKSRGDELRRGKKQLASIGNDSVTLGKTVYKVNFAPLSLKHPVYRESITVTRDNKVVYQSPGVMSFLRCGNPTKKRDHRDILVRLALVLLARGG